MTHREREGGGRRALETCAVLGALTVVLYACGGATAPESPGDEGAADASLTATEPSDEVKLDAPVVDPCSTLPRGASPDARSADGWVGCKSVAPSGRGAVNPAAREAGGSSLDFGGDGVARRWQSPYREPCAGPSIQLPVCVPARLEGCSTADKTRSCVLLTNPFQRSSPETTPNGHDLDREGRCWTLYDGHIDGKYGEEGEPVDGTFRATAERCGGRLEISGTFHASLAWKYQGSSK